MPENSYNWHVTLQCRVFCAFHSNDYQTAYNVIRNLSKDPLTYENITEQWRIYTAFVSFFIKIGRIKTGQKHSFKLGKFLNEVPVFTQDKRGSNVTILIIQILFLLLRRNKKEDELIARLNALKVYGYRHLRRDDTYRSNCFIKMLMVLPSGYFNPVAVARKAERHLQKLKEEPLDVAKGIETEVVPYEVLWECILDVLKKKRW